MSKRYYIYLLKDIFDNCIYVGKTINLKQRISSHISIRSSTWRNNNYFDIEEENKKSNEIHKVEYAECYSEVDMCIYEIYYINKFKPKYNKGCKFNDSICTLELPRLIFKPYGVTISKDAWIRVSDRQFNFDFPYSDENIKLIGRLLNVQLFPGMRFKYELQNGIKIMIQNATNQYASKINESDSKEALINYIKDTYPTKECV